MRVQLVEAAAQLLAEHGRDAVTARRLAAAVGASTQVLYTYFDGIDDVLAEVWREGFRRFGVALDEPAVTADPVADWMAQGWGYRRFAMSNPHLYRVMFAEGLMSMRLGNEEDVAAAGGTFLSLLTRIERCRDAGRWVVDDVWTAGEVIWSLSHGYASIELVGYYRGTGRDADATFTDCLRRTALGFQDDPDRVERSLSSARRRARRAASAA
jgi:AcrR family transcriptional regulator